MSNSLDNKDHRVTDQGAGRALRYNTGKLPFRYALTFPDAMRMLAETIGYGEQKYAPYNYMKGGPASQYVDCLGRHLTAWWNGEDNDPESGKSHLGHMVFNVLQLCSSRTADDRPGAVLRAKADFTAIDAKYAGIGYAPISARAAYSWMQNNPGRRVTAGGLEWYADKDGTVKACYPSGGQAVSSDFYDAAGLESSTKTYFIKVSK